MPVNVIVAVGAVVGFLSGPHPSLWAALAVGVIAASLVVLDARTGQQASSPPSE